ncbi:MAG: polysaccharide biosynthesis tyrosine autokinase [Alistipes sp.]|nr:polysaccharide biosynthesis tyrosine autokinase [Alistipes sp.]
MEQFQNNDSIIHSDNVNEIQAFSFQDMVEMVLKKWYWFVISVALFLGIGVLYIMKSSPVYQRNATIMVKDSRKGSGANEMAAFSEIAGLSTRRNVDNELFVLQARRLMVEVVERLGLTTSYRTRSGLRTVDLYRRSPIEVTFVNDSGTENCAFKVDLFEDKVFIHDFARQRPADAPEEDTDDFEVTAPYDTAIMTPSGEIVITRSLYMDEKYIGKTIAVTKNTKEIVATRYRTAMKSSVANKMSSIINISLNDIVAKRAEDVINTLIDVYNEDAVNDKQQVAEATADFIDVRLAIISKELGAVDSDIKTFKTRNSMVDIQAETETNLTVSTKLRSDVLSVESQLEMSKFIKEYLNDPQKEFSLVPATGFGNSANATSLAKHIADYNDLLLRREKLMQNGSVNNPVIQQLNSNRVAMKNAILASLDSNIAQLDIQLKNLRREKGKTDARISSVPLQEQEYLTIARQQRIKEELYLYLLNKREENAISLAITENTARIIDSAFGPNRPIAPRKSFVMLVMLILGCAVPFAILYMREILDTTVRSRQDIEKYTKVPYLGDIPVFSGKKSARGVAVRENGRDNISEAFRILRTNMGFMNTSGDQKVFLITSSNEHAGKTFVSTNLAMTYAFSGNKVLLIDLDLRRRTLSKHLGQRNNPIGISKYMSDHSVKVTDIISKSDLHENFDCIYAGLQPPNPAEQLLSNRLDELIAECRELYDYIIIDSVPALVIADALIASRIADLSIYVVREGLLDRRQLPDIDNLYRYNKLRNMCIILNGASERNHRYGYSYTYTSTDDDEFVYTRWEKFLSFLGFRKWVNKRKLSK